MKKPLQIFLLSCLLIIFPALSYYYLKKGFDDGLEIQEQIYDRGEFDLAIDNCISKDSLLGFFAHRVTLVSSLGQNWSVLDSLEFITAIFAEDDIFRSMVLADSSNGLFLNRESTSEVIYCDTDLDMSYGMPSCWVVDTSGHVVYESILNSEENYRYLTQVLARLMPRKKRSEILFERESEK